MNTFSMQIARDGKIIMAVDVRADDGNQMARIADATARAMGGEPIWRKIGVR